MSAAAAADVIVVGAGHNGLVAALRLARWGRRVLVLERRERPGGIAAAEEFHAGYRSAGLAQDTTGLRPRVVEELELGRHGLRLHATRPDLLALDRDGGALLLPGAPSGTRAPGFSDRDARRLADFRRFLRRVAGPLRAFLDEPPLDLVGAGPSASWLRRGLALRGLGREALAELLRVPPLAVADWLAEWFDSPLLRAALALSAVRGGVVGPRAPGTAFNLLLAEADAGPGVRGGPQALVAALTAAARERGIELRTSAPVRRILTDGAAVQGVALAGGEELRAPVVAAACDPRQVFLELLAPGAVVARLERRARRIRARGSSAEVLLALAVPPRFAARPNDPLEFARVAGSVDEIERAFDAIKYGCVAEAPALEIHVPSASDPQLAPAGAAVAAVLVHGVPHRPDPAWNDGVRRSLGDHVIGVLDRLAPGSASSVVACTVRTPADLERELALPGGQPYHAEHAIDQLLVRPVPECVGYRTPLRGLFLCSGGSHPVGWISGAPGSLAARAIRAASG